MNLNLQPFLDVAEILVRLDETERGLLILDNLPAFYRDFPPIEVRNLKSEIMSKITLPHDLLGDDRELPKTDEWSVQFLNGTARGLQLKELVKELNDKQIFPHIHDLGPGDFTFVLGLNKLGFEFTYSCLTLNRNAELDVSKRLGSKYKETPVENAVTIFVAYEIIEHLHNPMEIRQAFDRLKVMPDYILLSTPKYCYAEGTPNWRTEGIHHLKVFTPSEFMVEGIKMFPEYEFTFIPNEVMVISGVRK